MHFNVFTDQATGGRTATLPVLSRSCAGPNSDVKFTPVPQISRSHFYVFSLPDPIGRAGSRIHSLQEPT